MARRIDARPGGASGRKRYRPSSLRPAGIRTQRYPEGDPNDRGETIDVTLARREALSDALDAEDRRSAEIEPDDPRIPQRKRHRGHDDLVEELRLSLGYGALESRGWFEAGGGEEAPRSVRRVIPSSVVTEGRRDGFLPTPEDRAEARAEGVGKVRSRELEALFERGEVATGRLSSPEAAGRFRRAVAAFLDRENPTGLGVARQTALAGGSDWSREVLAENPEFDPNVIRGAAARRMGYDPPLDVCLLAAGADPVLAAGVARFAERAECSPWEVEKLGRTAGRLVGEFSRLCIEDPLRAESMERAWERRRGSPDAGSLESELWRTARYVARVHYAVGLDPVVEPMSREDVGRVLEARPRFDLREGVGAVGGTVQRSVPVWKLAQSVQEACLVNRKTVGLQSVAETSYCRERVQALGAAWPSRALTGLRERAAAEQSRARTGTLLEAVIEGEARSESEASRSGGSRRPGIDPERVLRELGFATDSGSAPGVGAEPAVRRVSDTPEVSRGTPAGFDPEEARRGLGLETDSPAAVDAGESPPSTAGGSDRGGADGFDPEAVARELGFPTAAAPGQGPGSRKAAGAEPAPDVSERGDPVGDRRQRGLPGLMDR